jgi:hypothetical protein
MSITVSVYQQDGLCRGPWISGAIFRHLGWLGDLVATPPGPLPGPDPVYTVEHPYGYFSWQLVILHPPVHQSWNLWVNDGERHDVWLPRAPGY